MKNMIQEITIKPMKQFNLEEAKAGAPVCTGDGRKVRIISFDRQGTVYPITALITEMIGETRHEYIQSFTNEGRFVEEGTNSEFDLYMAEEEEHFNIEDFKPFDKVLVRDENEGYWKCDFFSHYKKGRYSFRAAGFVYEQCIPYNDETKHLVGTADMPPKKYVNW